MDYSKKENNFDHVQLPREKGYDSDMEEYSLPSSREHKRSRDDNSVPTKRTRTESGSVSTETSSVASTIGSYLGLGSRKRKADGSSNGILSSAVELVTGPSSPRDERAKFIFPRSKLKGVIRDNKGKSMLADVGRQLLEKRKDNDLIDIAICENEEKGYYEMSFFYAGGVPITDKDVERASKTCEDRFRGMTTVPIELDERDRKEYSFGIMTQINLRLSCEG
jgi:hypothetical protein